MSLPAASHPRPETASEEQLSRIAALKKALRRTERANRAAAAQLAAHAEAQRLHMQQQPVYATPAAWQRQRQLLLNQPTPRILPGSGPPSAGSSASGPSARRASSTLPSPGPRSPLLHARSSSDFPAGLSPHLAASATTSPSLSGSAEMAATHRRLAAMQEEYKKLKEMKLLYLDQQAGEHQRSRIQKAFLYLNSGLIVLFVATLCYYDYLMLAPHVHALFWAGLFWVLLDAPQRGLLRAFAWLDQKVLNQYAGRIELFCAVLTVALGVWSAGRLSVLLVLGIVFLLCTFVLFGDRHTVTAVILLLLILLLLAFPLFFLAKTCVLESAEIASRLRSFIEGNEEFQHILEDFSTSATFLWVQSYCRSWGYEIPTTDVAKLREVILKSIVQFADQLTSLLTGVYSLLTNVGNMLVSLVTFASCLYFLLASSRDFSGTLTWLSPFRAEDNHRLVSTMKSSVEGIFVCSFCVGALHVLVTYVSFSLCGIDLCLILSFLSGFAAMLPIFSSWIVWLPACAGLIIAGSHVSAAVLACIQLTLLLYIDPLILSGIPGDSFIVGMSIVSAVYSFGASGVLLGPLLAGMTFTLISIYREYLSMPLMTPGTAAALSPAPPPPPTAAVDPAGLTSSLRRDPWVAPLRLGGQNVAATMGGVGGAKQAFSFGNTTMQAKPASQTEVSGAEGASLTLTAPSTTRPNARRRATEPLTSPLNLNPSRALRFATPLQAGPSPSMNFPTPNGLSSSMMLPSSSPSARSAVKMHAFRDATPAAAAAAATSAVQLPSAIVVEDAEGEEQDQAGFGASDDDDDEDAELLPMDADEFDQADLDDDSTFDTSLDPLSFPSPSMSLDSPLTLGSPAPVSHPHFSPAPSPPHGPAGFAIEAQRAHVESTHDRLILALEAQLYEMQEEQQRQQQMQQMAQEDEQAQQDEDEGTADADDASATSGPASPHAAPVLSSHTSDAEEENTSTATQPQATSTVRHRAAAHARHQQEATAASDVAAAR